jgi:hypothetical protein
MKVSQEGKIKSGSIVFGPIYTKALIYIPVFISTTLIEVSIFQDSERLHVENIHPHEQGRSTVFFTFMMRKNT